jgi:hypothetical protein
MSPLVPLYFPNYILRVDLSQFVETTSSTTTKLSIEWSPWHGDTMLSSTDSDLMSRDKLTRIIATQLKSHPFAYKTYVMLFENIMSSSKHRDG